MGIDPRDDGRSHRVRIDGDPNRRTATRHPRHGLRIMIDLPETVDDHGTVTNIGNNAWFENTRYIRDRRPIRNRGAQSRMGRVVEIRGHLEQPMNPRRIEIGWKQRNVVDAKTEFGP